MIKKDYIERVYSGLLGKIIGVRFGAPIEGWTYEKIEKEIGEIKGYIKDYKMFAADDDTNGPIVFIRTIDDYSIDADVDKYGNTWLNYISDNMGMFWWGGYGVSTENTAYLNLKNNIKAPLSGSILVNGNAVAEQIGGQIFIDVWGLVCPANPKLAAEYGEKAASVSHDGNGKFGGMFIAACIAEAFVEKDIKKIIKAGLSVIPKDCEYAKVTNFVMKYYDSNPLNWRGCFNYIKNNFGYDKYPGVCHIIPNSAVIILSLLYGEGDFDKTLCICNMCGWDTDCNVGNIGCIMGVRNGIEGISDYWREPINDIIVASTAIGDLNIIDIPSFAKYISKLGYKIAKENIPKNLLGVDYDGEVYDFEFSGSVHGFKTNSIDAHLENSNEKRFEENRALKLTVKNENVVSIYRKTNYRPSDFDDDRYCPKFSPIVYPGYNLQADVFVLTDNVYAAMYIKDGNSGNIIYGDKIKCDINRWNNISFKISYLDGVCIDEMGIEFSSCKNIDSSIFIDSIKYTALPDYKIDFSKEKMEVWTSTRISPSQLTILHGNWELSDGMLSGSGYGNCESYTGSRKWENYELECEIIPIWGKKHNINFRVWGGMKSYAAGLSEDDNITLYKNIDGKYKKLISNKYKWTYNKGYKIKIKAVKNKFEVYMNDKLFITYVDEKDCYLKGQVGFSTLNGHTHYKYLRVKNI